jgi:cytochrome b involved in lipid metabolism
MSEPKQFLLAEVASHKTKASVYVAIKGSVYDVTKFIDEVGIKEKVRVWLNNLHDRKSFFAYKSSE